MQVEIIADGEEISAMIVRIAAAREPAQRHLNLIPGAGDETRSGHAAVNRAILPIVGGERAGAALPREPEPVPMPAGEIDTALTHLVVATADGIGSAGQELGFHQPGPVLVNGFMRHDVGGECRRVRRGLASAGEGETAGGDGSAGSADFGFVVARFRVHVRLRSVDRGVGVVVVTDGNHIQPLARRANVAGVLTRVTGAVERRDLVMISEIIPILIGRVIAG